MIHEFLCAITITALVIIAYIKLRYPFWHRQPMYHSYDIWRMSIFNSEPYVIYKYRPVKTKFYDPEHVRSVPYLELTKSQKRELVNLVQCFYIPTDRILHTIVKKDMDIFFSGNNDPAYVSFYYEDRFSITNQKDVMGGVVSESTLPIGCITSRPITLYYRPTQRERAFSKTAIYFMDYLCIEREQGPRKTDMSRKLLQTHEYNQRIKNPAIQISLLKAETDLFGGVVPFIEYTISTYSLRNSRVLTLPPHFQVVRIYKENLQLLQEFMYNETQRDFSRQPGNMDIMFLPDISTLTALIRRQLLYVFCLQRENSMYGIYFIKNARLRYEDVDGNTLHCVASVMNYDSIAVKDEGRLFYAGFQQSLQQIIRERPSFKMILFDEIGNNQVLTRLWREQYTPLYTSQAAYYLFNWIYPCSPIVSSRCFVLL